MKYNMGNKMMLFVLVFLLYLSPVHAANFPDYSFFGGIQGDLTMKAGVYYYQEISFLSGEPIVLTGTISIPPVKDTNKKSYKTTIKYSLNNPQKNASLERTVNYEIKNEYNEIAKQRITNVAIPIGGISEVFSKDGDVYTLTSFQFSNANISEQHHEVLGFVVNRILVSMINDRIRYLPFRKAN